MMTLERWTMQGRKVLGSFPLDLELPNGLFYDIRYCAWTLLVCHTNGLYMTVCLKFSPNEGEKHSPHHYIFFSRMPPLYFISLYSELKIQICGLSCRWPITNAPFAVHLAVS
jgi:hypothetical protein